MLLPQAAFVRTSPLVLAMTLSTVFAVQGASAGERELPAPGELPLQVGMPIPLVKLDGSLIETKQDWNSRRKPELKRLFQHYMYGYFPPKPDKISAEVVREDDNYFGGKATKREVTIHYGPSGTPPINLLLVIPKERQSPAPCFVGLNFCGNYALVDDPAVPLPTVWMYPNQPGVQDNRATEAGRGRQKDVWALEQSIDRGYAVATFYNGDVDPDTPDFADGIQPHYFQQGQTEPGPHDWGTIAAWAYGMHRAVDYLATDPDIDAERICAVGHSRLGKTALLAAAFDERIALAIPHQAGCGGTAPSRGKVGESVERINTAFPHWFNDTFPQFNQQVERLPFDQNCLAALCAPRPILFSNAEEDTWANPVGQFEVLKAAESAYKLLGAQGCAADEPPPNGKLIDSTLGYYIRPGAHSMTAEDWQVFLDFADKNLK